MTTASRKASSLTPKPEDLLPTFSNTYTAAWLHPAGLATLATKDRAILPKHLKLLYGELLAVVAGENDRLIIEMPPRHFKSTTVNQFFVPWLLGSYPDMKVGLASYEADFASQWGRKARDILEEYGQQVFGVKLRGDSSAANRWDIAGHDGGMWTAGVGGPITGKGADLLICDDPIKNAEEAMSEVIREKQWAWWQSTFYTRSEGLGAIILIMTRWHEDDLAGRLLAAEEEGGDRWRRVRLPALAEENDLLGREVGEPLCPEMYPKEWLLRRKRAVGSHYWEAMYQQRPVPPGGAMFKREWFEIVNDYPRDAQSARYWDLAATEAKAGSDPDWTAGCGGCIDAQSIFYITDVRRDRITPQSVERLIMQTAQTDGVECRVRMEQEPGAAGKNVIDHYRRRVLIGYDFDGVLASGAKEVRAQPWASYAEAGNIKLVRGPWNKAFLDEVERFPFGSHDDQVDALSGLCETLGKPVYRSWAR